MGCDHTRALIPDLLREILKRVPEDDRLRNVPFVSLRLSQACRDPALWPNLHVPCADSWTEAKWSCFLRWLVPRAAGLQTLRFHNPKLSTSSPLWPSQSGFHDLCRYAVDILPRINFMDGDTEHQGQGQDELLWFGGGAAWVPRLRDLISVLAARAPQLQILELRYPGSAYENTQGALSADLPLADLMHLSQLTSLTLEVGQTPIEIAPLCTVLRALPALEHLSLTSTRCAWEKCLVGVATSCPQLTCLQMGCGFNTEKEPVDAPEEMGLLTNLVELSISNLELYSLPDSMCKLTSLQRLLISDAKDIAVELPPGLTACRQLSQLRIPSDKDSPVLADLKFLQQLEITQCPEVRRSEVLGEMFWPRLTGLTELKLRFNEWTPDEVLEGLVGMTGLRKLTLEDAMDAANLPMGPYLIALESLCLDCCSGFKGGLPSNLAAATGLRHLELAGQHYAYGDPNLFFSLLESCPAVETVHLSHYEDEISLDWNGALLQYRDRCSAQGRSNVVITHA